MPSHGKETDRIRLPAGLEEEEARSLNQRADVAASVALLAAERGYLDWYAEVAAAEHWSTRVLNVAGAIGVDYNSLCQPS